MKTWGVWERVVKFTSLAIGSSGLILLASFQGNTKRIDRPETRVPSSGASGPSSAKENPRWIEAYSKLPLSFEENQGQTAHEVLYVSRGAGYELFLTSQEAVLVLQATIPHDLSPLHRFDALRAMREASRARMTTAIRVRFEGANSAARISGADRLPTRVNYFIGKDPKKWRTDVPSYARVKYAEIYPGVDLVFYGNQGRLEYDLIVAPRADPKSIRLSLEGSEKLRVDAQGDLIMSVSGGEVVVQKPFVYQMVKGERHEIAGNYVFEKGHQVTLSVAAYDRNEPLIFDPVLNYSTYLGGSTGDLGSSITVDSMGDAFLTGTTLSTTFPTKNGFGVGNAKGVAFVTELNPAGTQLVYSTYLGGSGGDSGRGIALDPSGNVYVTGQTKSTDFPTTSNGLKTSSAGATNGTSFISKINPATSGINSLVYSSYLGGTAVSSFGDLGSAIAADASGNAYVTGFTASSPGSGAANFPITTTNAFQATLGTTSGNAFLTRIDTTQSGSNSLIYSTYLGGSGAKAASSGLGFGEFGTGVAVDSSKNAYIAGTTTSTDFPTTTTGFQTKASPPAAVAGGTVFVSRIDTTKTGSASLIYSTYVGGNTSDFGLAIALKPSSTVAYVTGNTTSTAFPTFPAGAYQTVGGGSTASAFVSLIDTGQMGSTSLKYSTYLGGGGTSGSGIQSDAAGNAYVGGLTQSTAFPRTPGAFQPSFAIGAAGEGFITKLNPVGNGAADLIYSTFFGGSGSASGFDSINSIAVDSSNPANAYVTGQTFSSPATFPVFPTTPPTAFQPTLIGTSDAFVAKLTPIPTLVVSPTSLNFGTVLIPNTSSAQTVTLTNNTNAAIAFTSAIISGGNPAAANNDYVATSGCGASIAAGASCTVSVTFKPSVAAAETATLVLTDGDSTSPQKISLTGSGTNTPPDFTVTAPATATGTIGTPVNITVTVTPMGGFSSTVTLTCTEPAALTLSTCTPSPGSVTPNGGPVTSTVTVTTTALMVPPTRMPTPPVSWRQIVPLVLAILLLFLLPKTQRLRAQLGMVTAIILFIVLAGCSGPPKPHTIPGTYNLRITGTSGPTMHTATVALTVN